MRKDIHTDLKPFSIAAPIGENIFTEAKGTDIYCSLNRPGPDSIIRQELQWLVAYLQDNTKPAFGFIN